MASDEKIDEKIIDSKHRADAVVRRITRIRWRGSGGVIHHRKTSAAGNHREAENGSIGFASRRAAVARRDAKPIDPFCASRWLPAAEVFLWWITPPLPSQ